MNNEITVHRYRIWCESEQTYVYTWDTETPTKCPNNIEHSINETVVSIDSTLATNIKGKGYKGISQSTCICVNIPPDEEIYTETVTWPCSIYFTRMQIISTKDNIDDELNLILNPDTPVGIITSYLEKGNNTLQVDRNVIDFLFDKIGSEIVITSFKEESRKFNLGRVLEIDEEKLTVTVEFASPEMEFEKESIISSSFYFVKNYQFNPSYQKQLTFSSSTPITTLSCQYKNNNRLVKKLYIEIDYTY
jgi:hypothetical protein